jgi:hypothetical protein
MISMRRKSGAAKLRCKMALQNGAVKWAYLMITTMPDGGGGEGIFVAIGSTGYHQWGRTFGWD